MLLPDWTVLNAAIDWLANGLWNLSWWQIVIYTLVTTHITIASVTDTPSVTAFTGYGAQATAMVGMEVTLTLTPAVTVAGGDLILNPHADGKNGVDPIRADLTYSYKVRAMTEVELPVTNNLDDVSSDTFIVHGRGELHLTILLENMRREGYELAVSRPRVVTREVNGEKQEPYEMLTVDVDESNQGAVMEALGARRGELQDMQPDGKGRVRLDYRIPARGLIGFQSDFMTMTRGTGIMSHVFDEYAPAKAEQMAERRNGVLISQDDGAIVAYAIWKLQERGRMFVSPGEPVYEGMIVGIHSRDNDLVVNPIRTKQLTNIRASGKDEAIDLVTPIALTLEYAVEFIADDELVEITPKSIRLRKRFLKESDRRRADRAAA